MKAMITRFAQDRERQTIGLICLIANGFALHLPTYISGTAINMMIAFFHGAAASLL